MRRRGGVGFKASSLDFVGTVGLVPEDLSPVQAGVLISPAACVLVCSQVQSESVGGRELAL